MREKLNDNPTVQIAFVVLLLIATGYLMMTRIFGGSEAPANPPATAVTTDPTTGAAIPASGDPASPVPAAAAVSTRLPPDIAPPEKVERAYEDDKTVVLLVIRGGAIDDRLAAQSARLLRSRSDVALFISKAQHVARYAAIAAGVGLDRVPALVVIRPKKLNGGGPAPASISYGFEDAQSVEQAVDDANYKGPEVGYAPG